MVIEFIIVDVGSVPLTWQLKLELPDLTTTSCLLKYIYTIGSCLLEYFTQ